MALMLAADEMLMDALDALGNRQAGRLTMWPLSAAEKNMPRGLLYSLRRCHSQVDMRAAVS